MKVKSESEVAQSCPTLCDPMDYSLPGSSVHGILQARVLEWGAIPFSKGNSQYSSKLDNFKNTDMNQKILTKSILQRTTKESTETKLSLSFSFQTPNDVMTIFHPLV